MAILEDGIFNPVREKEGWCYYEHIPGTLFRMRYPVEESKARQLMSLRMAAEKQLAMLRER